MPLPNGSAPPAAEPPVKPKYWFCQVVNPFATTTLPVIVNDTLRTVVPWLFTVLLNVMASKYVPLARLVAFPLMEATTFTLLPATMVPPEVERLNQTDENVAVHVRELLL